ncbi:MULTISPECIES: PIG-L deacetylase family protein [unclassified Streptomyces]|uniref:PIG-L deacetylase family protein n=1 Tax=unclassified Streptomyces TaxID=2593676 RepID=UPI002E78EF7A|nr:PIG-L deacetylase family protein [Streptomyces sp. JV190]MEE1839042.1 PIG-L family deacetylase [Streptomyces sp. JV190]
MTPSHRNLAPLNENWQTALAIVAHPDDLEYGAASAVARWTAQGKDVSYCLVTSGEAGIDGVPPGEARPVREAEQRASAGIVGVGVVDFLGFPDGVLEYGLPLRLALARQIRARRPDIVITNNFRDFWDAEELGTEHAPLNHTDHIATGRAILDAVRDAANRWVFTDLLDEGLEPWGGVRQVWAAHSPLAGHAVDITGSFDRGVASLEAHGAYIKGLGRADFVPAEFLESLGRRVGTHFGCRLATSFEVLRFASDD